MTKMKKLLSVILIAVIVAATLTALAACGTKMVKVTFDYNYDGAPEALVVETEMGTPVAEPEEPVREGFKFDGWAPEPDSALSFNFAANINEDRTFYARWTPNLTDNYPNPGTLLATMTGSTYKMEIYSSRVSKVFEKDGGKFVDSFQNYSVKGTTFTFGEWITGKYTEYKATATDGVLSLTYGGDKLTLNDYSALTEVEAGKILLDVIGPDVKVSLKDDGLLTAYFNVGDGYGGWAAAASGFWSIKQNIVDDFSSESVDFYAVINGMLVDAGINQSNEIYMEASVELGGFKRTNIVTERRVLWVPALLNVSVPAIELVSSGKNIVELYYGGIDNGEGKPEGNLLKIVNSETKAEVVSGEWVYDNKTNVITLTIGGKEYVLGRMGGQWNYNTLTFKYDNVTYSTEIIDWESMLLAQWPEAAIKGLVFETINAKSSTSAANVANYSLTLYENKKAYFYGETTAGVITARGAGTWDKVEDAYEIKITDREFGEFDIKLAYDNGDYKTTLNMDKIAGLTDNMTSNRIFGDVTLSFSEVTHTFNGLTVGGNIGNSAMSMKLRGNGTLELNAYIGTDHSAYGTYTYDKTADEFTFVIKDSVSDDQLFSGKTTKSGDIYMFSYSPVEGSTAVMKWQETPTTVCTFTGSVPYNDKMSFPATATFYSDGTATVSVQYVGTSNGCWVYDEKTDTYSYAVADSNGDSAGRVGDSKYDRETKTYTISYRSMGHDVELKYTPAKA